MNEVVRMGITFVASVPTRWISVDGALLLADVTL